MHHRNTVVVERESEESWGRKIMTQLACELPRMLVKRSCVPRWRSHDDILLSWRPRSSVLVTEAHSVLISVILFSSLTSALEQQCCLATICLSICLCACAYVCPSVCIHLSAVWSSLCSVVVVALWLSTETYRESVGLHCWCDETGKTHGKKLFCNILTFLCTVNCITTEGSGS